MLRGQRGVREEAGEDRESNGKRRTIQVSKSSDSSRWWTWIGGAVGVVALILVLPFAVTSQLINRVLGTDKECVTPDELAGRLRKFIDGTFEADDFADMTDRIKDPYLEEIRREFMTIKIPADEAGRERLFSLLDRVERQITP